MARCVRLLSACIACLLLASAPARAQRLVYERIPLPTTLGDTSQLVIEQMKVSNDGRTAALAV